MYGALGLQLSFAQVAPLFQTTPRAGYVGAYLGRYKESWNLQCSNLGMAFLHVPR